MKTEVKKLPKSRIEILFELSWEEFEPFLGRAANKLSKNLKLKGFRPGKAPQELVEKEVGEGKILAEAAELAVKAKYPRFVAEEELEVINQPQIEVLKLARNNPFCFRTRVEVLPEINLPDYKKIASEIKKQAVEVEEKEVKDTLNFLQQSRAQFQDLKKAAKKGDFVEVEYQSPQVENNKAYKDSFFLGKGQFVAGFEENLEGMKAGEEKEFSVVFPKDYFKKELAEKKAQFKAKLNKVQSVKMPVLDDEFAKKLGRFDNLKALKQSLKQGIKKEKEMAENQRWQKQVLEKIGKELDFEAPESLVYLEQERTLEGLRQKVKSELKVSFEEYLKGAKKTEDELKKTFLEEARVRVRNFLVLRAIGKQEKIEVQPEEIERALNNFLKNYPTVEKAKKEIDLERLRDYYKGVIYNNKVFAKLESCIKND